MVIVCMCCVCPWEQSLCLWERVHWHWCWHGCWGRWHHSRSGSSLLLSIMMFRAICMRVPKICSIAFVEVSCGYHHGKWNLDRLQMIERAEEKMARGDQWSDGGNRKQTHKDDKPSDLETVDLSWMDLDINVVDYFLVWERMFNYVSDDRAIRRIFYEKQCVKLWAVKHNWEESSLFCAHVYVGWFGNIAFTTTMPMKNFVNWNIKWKKKEQMRWETDEQMRTKIRDRMRRRELRIDEKWNFIFNNNNNLF